MSKLKFCVFFLIISFSNLLHSQFTDEINSNRPGRSMMAFSVGKTVIQAEAGFFGLREKHDLLQYTANGFAVDLEVRYGFLFEQLELNAQFQVQSDKYKSRFVEENRSGMKVTTFGAKYLFYDPWKNYEEKPNLYSWKANHRFKWRQMIPAISAYVGINFGFSNNPYYPTPDNQASFSPKAMIITQNHFGEKWVFVTNIFADKLSTEYQNFGYVMTLTRGFNSDWSGFIENQAIIGDLYSDGIFRIGAARLIGSRFQVDASIGTNYKDTPSLLFGGIGASWRFDKNYKEVKIEKESGTKDEKRASKKKKKDKEKKKKRLDEVEP